MRLVCEACGAGFNVPDAAIPAEGRKVKCAKCGHVWHATPAQPSPSPEIDTPILDDAPVPDSGATEDDQAALKALANLLSEEEPGGEEGIALRKAKRSGKRPIRKPYYIALALIVVAIALTSIFALRDVLYPTLSPLYDLLGMTTNDKVIIEKIAYEDYSTDRRARYAVSGEIVNTAEVPMSLPILRISLQDENRSTFVSRDYEESRVLEAGERYPFNVGPIETAFIDRTHYIQIEVGNSYELSVRE